MASERDARHFINLTQEIILIRPEPVDLRTVLVKIINKNISKYNINTEGKKFMNKVNIAKIIMLKFVGIRH